MDSSLKKNESIKRIIICIAFLVLLWGGGIIINEKIKNRNEDMEYITQDVFLRTKDIAFIIDKYGENERYLLQFEIRSDNPGEVLVYFENSGNPRYNFQELIWASEEYQEFTMVVTPVVNNLSSVNAYVSFYGNSDKNVKPMVRRVRFNVIK